MIGVKRVRVVSYYWQCPRGHKHKLQSSAVNCLHGAINADAKRVAAATARDALRVKTETRTASIMSMRKAGATARAIAEAHGVGIGTVRATIERWRRKQVRALVPSGTNRAGTTEQKAAAAALVEHGYDCYRFFLEDATA